MTEHHKLFNDRQLKLATTVHSFLTNLIKS